MHRRTTHRRLLALAAVPLLLAGLAGCGGKDKASQAGGDAKTGSAVPAALDVKPGQEVPTKDFLAAMKSGVGASTTAVIGMKMSVAGTEISADGQVDYTTKSPSMALNMSLPMLGDQPIEMRLIDSMLYMNLGQMSGNKFAVIDINDPNGPMGDLSTLTDGFDPVRSFEQLTPAIDKAVFVGEDTIDGDSVRQYRMTIDTAKVTDAMGALKAAGGGSAAGLPDTLTYDVWTDDHNRMRKVNMDLGSTGSLEMTTSHWGDPVSIEAPPKSEQVDLSSLVPSS